MALLNGALEIEVSWHSLIIGALATGERVRGEGKKTCRDRSRERGSQLNKEQYLEGVRRMEMQH